MTLFTRGIGFEVGLERYGKIKLQNRKEEAYKFNFNLIKIQFQLQKDITVHRLVIRSDATKGAELGIQ